MHSLMPIVYYSLYSCSLQIGCTVSSIKPQQLFRGASFTWVVSAYSWRKEILTQIFKAMFVIFINEELNDFFVLCFIAIFEN